MDKNGNVLGMKRDMTAEGCLGLILMWYRTRGSCARSLAMHFGQTSTPMYKWLKFGRRILLVCLMDDPDARVTVPTLADVRRYQKAIGDKYPLVGDVWGAADGLKLGVESSGNYAIQNMYYNGWTHGHYINNIFVFACDGKIRISLQNCPGTFHDSTMSDYGVYDKMEQLYRSTGGKVVVDSAFKIPTGNFLIKSSQTDPVNARELLINRQATSVRQLSEWGMRMIQGQFPRLNDPLKYEENGERKVILRLMTLIYNFQTRFVGINQILNSFMEKDTGFFQHEGITLDANDYLE